MQSRFSPRKSHSPACTAAPCTSKPARALAEPFRALSAKMSDFARKSLDFTAKHCKSAVFRCFCTANYCKSALIKRFSANHAFIIGLTLRKSHNPARRAAPCCANPVRALGEPLRAPQSPQVRSQSRFTPKSDDNPAHRAVSRTAKPARALGEPFRTEKSR